MHALLSAGSEDAMDYTGTTVDEEDEESLTTILAPGRHNQPRSHVPEYGATGDHTFTHAKVTIESNPAAGLKTQVPLIHPMLISN